jgi:signal transduction histidine kinase
MTAAVFASETFAPLWRTRTYARVLYLLMAFPIGLATFLLVVVGGALGGGLAIVWVGVPILLGLLAASRALAALDRRLANALLGTQIDAPAQQRSRGGSIWTQVKALVSARTTWSSLLWLVLRFPLGMLAFCTIAVFGGVGVALLIAPFTDAFSEAHAMLGTTATTKAVCVLGGAALLLLTLHVTDGLAWLHGAVARGLLGPSRRDELAALAARSERADARADLARELHDSVGHSVTAAVLQASAARRVLATDPAFAEGALAAIEAQGRDALDELDRVLAVLREEDGGTRAAPSLADVDELLARTRAAGQSLSVTRTGDFERVPAAVGREAYRVLQEALTNVMRHASGAATTVALTVGEDALELNVENGPGAALDPTRRGGGNGLRGVGERLRALGGTLVTSEREDGGYKLRAELPFRAGP